jgi:hypothetical protein
MVCKFVTEKQSQINKFVAVVTSDPARFNRLVAALVNATADSYNSTRRYASGEADFDQEYPKV